MQPHDRDDAAAPARKKKKKRKTTTTPSGGGGPSPEERGAAHDEASGGGQELPSPGVVLLPGSSPNDDDDDDDQSSSHFKHVELAATFGLLPHTLDDVSVHVWELLQASLMKYHAELGGVPVSLASIRLAPGHEHGTIRHGDPRIYVTARLAACVFCPRVGGRLVGRVTKVESAFVGLLVHGLFNASIAAADLTVRGYAFEETRQEWISSEGRTEDDDDGAPPVLRLGSYVVFALLRTHEARGILAMDGALDRVVVPSRGHLTTTTTAVCDDDDDDTASHQQPGAAGTARSNTTTDAAANGSASSPPSQNGDGPSSSAKVKKKKKKKPKGKLDDTS